MCVLYNHWLFLAGFKTYYSRRWTKRKTLYKEKVCAHIPVDTNLIGMLLREQEERASNVCRNDLNMRMVGFAKLIDIFAPQYNAGKEKGDKETTVEKQNSM